jgi:hypothetical protein
LTQQQVELEAVLTTLEQTPAAFEAALTKLGATGFERRPAADEWSPLEVLTHVRASDLIVSTRIWSALVRPDAVHPGLDEREYGDLLTRAGLPADDQVRAFTLRRQELLGLLRTLSDKDWNETVHTDFGEKSVLQVAVAMAAHETEHVSQLRAAATGTGSSATS